MRGFTLIELSIVLVIIALLVGGVLAGQSLIHASELRSVMSEYQRYSEATNSFRNKYLTLPGDMPNATSFWGAAPSNQCPGDATHPSTTAVTCNGNGDSVISQQTGAAAGDSREMFRYWQHLKNAELIAGQYSGTNAGAWDTSSLIGTNVPQSRLKHAGWSIFSYGVATVSDVSLFEGDYNNVFILGTETANTLTNGVILTPEEAWHIDNKMDDENPGTGLIRTYESMTNCHNAGISAVTALAATARYAVTTPTQQCALIFRLQ